MHLTVCSSRGLGSIPSRGGEFQGISPWLITHTRGGDGRHRVITSPLKGYDKYEAIQLLLPSGPSDDQNGHGSFKRNMDDQSLAREQS